MCTRNEGSSAALKDNDGRKDFRPDARQPRAAGLRNTVPVPHPAYRTIELKRKSKPYATSCLNAGTSPKSKCQNAGTSPKSKETLQNDWGNSTAINERAGLNSSAKINQQRHSQMAKCCERRSVVSAGERRRQVPARRRHNAGTMPAKCLLYYRKMVAVHHPDYCTNSI